MGKMYCELLSRFSKLFNIRSTRLLLGYFARRFILIYFLLAGII